MDKARRMLVEFCETAKGFDPAEKLKVILFACGAKPNTFVALKVNPKNIGEKYHFEQHLNDCGILFEAGKAKAYEQIAGMRGNSIVWKIMGTWYGYDLFRDKNAQKQFHNYVGLVKKQRHEKADLIAGKLYGYPACCVRQYIREHDVSWLAKHYSYYEFYKRLSDSARNFPFVQHTACSPSCKATAKLNKKYAAAINKFAPRFYREFSAKKTYDTELVIEGESDITTKGVLGGETIWPKKDGHDYSVVSRIPFEGKYYMYGWLTRECYARGTVFKARVTMQYSYADIKPEKTIKVIKDLHHIRRFVVPARNY